MPAMTPADPDLADLDTHGAAVLPTLLSPAECASMVALWDDPARFRKEVVMARHGYGSGTYRYFDYPLPEPVARLRTALYPSLARIANRWAAQLGRSESYPEEHQAYIDRCRALGQIKPTPLILRYGPGDWNALHQDIYGECVFPLQVVVLLSAPGRDFSGGEFVLSEQRPRMQSRPEVVHMEQGDAVVFPVRERPVPGQRGYRKVQLRHGVSRVQVRSVSPGE